MTSLGSTASAAGTVGESVKSEKPEPCAAPKRHVIEPVAAPLPSGQVTSNDSMIPSLSWSQYVVTPTPKKPDRISGKSLYRSWGMVRVAVYDGASRCGATTKSIEPTSTSGSTQLGFSEGTPLKA